jgi:hypothetical protein
LIMNQNHYIKMKKKSIILILGIFLLVSVTAIITLPNGDKLIGEDELKTKTDQEIESSMENSIECESPTLLQNKIRVRCNISYLEPTLYHCLYGKNVETKQLKKIVNII